MKISKLKELLKKFDSKIFYNEDLKKKNWFNIGGKAKIFFKVNELKDLIDFLKILQNREKIFIIGAGSNVLITDDIYDGIVITAISYTLSILFVMLTLYRTGIIKPTENFKLGLAAGTGGIALIYLVNFVMSFFGTGLSIMDINNASMLSIGFSLFVIVMAALNLVVDFDFIEEGSEKGAPKYMEWFGAFGLMVTLIWLYIEILRLLAKMNSRK